MFNFNVTILFKIQLIFLCKIGKTQCEWNYIYVIHRTNKKIVIIYEIIFNLHFKISYLYSKS